MDIEQDGHGHDNEKIDVFYDGNAFPFEDSSFDSIISNQVLEHVFNPDKHLSEIRRVLKTGGKILISVPFLWDEHEQPYDYARYSSFGLRHLLEINGFEIIEQRKSVASIHAIFQLINAYIFKKTLWCRRGILSFLVTILLNAPVNVMGVIVGLILPVNDDLYLDNIMVAIKRE
jgi:SAM-dependent methyltransferase